MYWSKVCVQEFWYLVSGLDIQPEKSQYDSPEWKKTVAGGEIRQVIYWFFSALDANHGFVVKVSRSAFGDFGSIPDGCWAPGDPGSRKLHSQGPWITSLRPVWRVRVENPSQLALFFKYFLPCMCQALLGHFLGGSTITTITTMHQNSTCGRILAPDQTPSAPKQWKSDVQTH